MEGKGGVIGEGLQGWVEVAESFEDGPSCVHPGGGGG